MTEEYSAEEITQITTKKGNDEKPLYDRIREDFKTWIGEQGEAEDGYEPFTDNTPMDRATKAVTSLWMSKKDLQIPIKQQQKGEREEESEAERFIDGYFEHVDHLRALRGQIPVAAEMAFQAYVPGCIVALPLIFKDGANNNETTPFLDFWYRPFVRYEMGDEGLRWIAHVQKMTPIQILSRYGIRLENKAADAQIDFIDFWTAETHSQLIDGEFREGKQQKPHQIGFNPGLLLPSGATPLIYDQDITDSFMYSGESGFKGCRNMLAPFNTLMAAFITYADRTRKPKWKIFSSDGTFTITEDLGEADVLGVELNVSKLQDIKPLEFPELPEQSVMILQALADKIAMTFPDFPFTGLRGDKPWSGQALNVAEKASMITTHPFKMNMQRAYEEIALSICRQFSSSFKGNNARGSNLGLKPIEFQAKTSTGDIDLTKFKPSKIKPFRFKCNLNIDLPKDLDQRYINARILREENASGDPLASDLTIMETMRDVFPDPDGEQTRKLAQTALNLRMVKINAMLRAILDTTDKTDKDAMLQAEAVFDELTLARAEFRNAMMETKVQETQMGAMLAQSPTQGMNPGAQMPMEGMPPGSVPGAVVGGGVVPPEIELARQMAQQGLR